MLADSVAEAGLEGLAEKERDLLYAFVRLASMGQPVRSDAIRSHALVASMAHPTYHRTLRSLLDLGFVIKASGARRRSYVLVGFQIGARYEYNVQTRALKCGLQCSRDNHKAYEREMNDKLERLAKLREMLLRLEGELGLGDLSRFARELLYAMRDLAGLGQLVKSADLRSHNLTVRMAQPTFHRALRELIAHGYLRHAKDTRARYYVVTTPAL